MSAALQHREFVGVDHRPQPVRRPSPAGQAVRGLAQRPAAAAGERLGQLVAAFGAVELVFAAVELGRLGGNRGCLAVARKMLKRSFHTLRELGEEAVAPA